MLMVVPYSTVGGRGGCWLFESPELCRAAPWGRSSACCHSKPAEPAGSEDDWGVAETPEPEPLACALDDCITQEVVAF